MSPLNWEIIIINYIDILKRKNELQYFLKVQFLSFITFSAKN